MGDLTRRDVLKGIFYGYLGLSAGNFVRCAFQSEAPYTELNSKGEFVDPRLIIREGISDSYARQYVRENLPFFLGSDTSLDNILVAICKLNYDPSIKPILRDYRLNYGEYLKQGKNGCCGDRSIAVATATEIAAINDFEGDIFSKVRETLNGSEMGVLGVLKWQKPDEDHALNIFSQPNNFKILDMQEPDPFVNSSFVDCLDNLCLNDRQCFVYYSASRVYKFSSSKEGREFLLRTR